MPFPINYYFISNLEFILHNLTISIKPIFSHYGKPAICRVPESLPSVFYRALGKDRVCRVSNKIHSANKNTRQNTSLPSVFFLALGKDVFCRVLFFGTRQNTSLPSVFFWHCILSSALVLALGKQAFCRVHFFWPSANHFFKAIFEALNEFK